LTVKGTPGYIPTFMASLYKRGRFWWVKYRNERGDVVQESTKCRVGNRSDWHKALDFKAQLAAKEAKRGAGNKPESFESWVESYISIRYKGSTLSRVKAAWRRVHAYLGAQRITDARQVSRADCLSYIAHRNSKGIKTSSALTEMAYFSSIMSEAVRRGMRVDNPCHNLDVTAGAPQPKREITDEEIALIRQEIERSGQNKELLAALNRVQKTEGWNPQQFFEASFEIAIHQGCRLSETLIDLHRDVDLENEEISFHAKGDKFYTTTLHPDLKEKIIQWKREGRVNSYRTIPVPRWKQIASFYWSAFFKHLGLSHLCFHCTRVTVVSRLHRAGVPEGIAMQMVNHSSSIVHRIYKRTKKEQLCGLWPSMGVSSPSPDKL
jgi:site-specific recombinase XerD